MTKALSGSRLGGAVSMCVEEGGAGGALFVEYVALRTAGVDEQAKGEGKVGVEVEVADGLGVVVDLEDEVVLGEGLDEGAFFVADDYGQVDEAGVDGEGGGGWSWCLFGLGRRGLQNWRLLGVHQGGGKQQERGEQEGPQGGWDCRASGVGVAHITIRRGWLG